MVIEPTIDPGIGPAFIVTAKLTIGVTFILACIAPPAAAVLVGSPAWIRRVLEPILKLPLVLPPTVLGFYLLMLFSSAGNTDWLPDPIALNISKLSFHLSGITLAMAVVGLPLAMTPIVSAMDSMPRQWFEAARCLGLNRIQTFFRLTLPVCRGSIIAGLLLAAAQAMGAFGIILMVGGNIPGSTRTLSVAIYDSVQSLDYAAAHRGSLILLASATLTMIAISFLNRPRT